MTRTINLRYSGLTLAAGALSLVATMASADQVINDDLIVVGSACIGQDCVNGESFGFDTIRLKENNLRIKFQDTSNSASFPSRDWQITANDSNNGGANKFSIDDIDGGRTPFTLEAGAPSHSLYVDDGGRIGLGTSTPVVEMQIVDGDSPTIRLEQDGSSGFTAQTWDIAGNETNFFVRDVTNGSKLPFKVFPNAPTNSLIIEGTGDIGIGTQTPEAALDIRRSGTQILLGYQTSGGTATTWNMVMDGDDTPNEGISFTRAGSGEREFRITPQGAIVLPTSTAAEHASISGNGAIYFDGDTLCVKIGGAFVPMNNSGDATCS